MTTAIIRWARRCSTSYAAARASRQAFNAASRQGGSSKSCTLAVEIENHGRASREAPEQLTSGRRQSEVEGRMPCPCWSAPG
jgi:copper oxidase (laccase) domain-containing protein